jgi:hypothetical protein
MNAHCGVGQPRHTGQGSRHSGEGPRPAVLPRSVGRDMGPIGLTPGGVEVGDRGAPPPTNRRWPAPPADMACGLPCSVEVILDTEHTTTLVGARRDRASWGKATRGISRAVHKDGSRGGVRHRPPWSTTSRVGEEFSPHAGKNPSAAVLMRCCLVGLIPRHGGRHIPGGAADSA